MDIVFIEQFSEIKSKYFHLLSKLNNGKSFEIQKKVRPII